ncbi:MAG: glycosyltransferase family 2 protein [Peptoanaerobacter stomatis]|uniref:glycosyltransferase family 2 protein n=1 Tax=Peptoanaerobacter stomatis TaxID=796937 RepID=UPI003FA081FA
MDNEKLVSVIIPCYNSEEYLEQSIGSITNQTYKNLEILIIDDCSTDNSLSILKKIKACDSRIKVYSNKKNMKIVYTLNRLIKMSKGTYIARMDADDISFPERIKMQVDFLEKHPNTGFCGTNAYHIDKNNIVIGSTALPLDAEDIKKSLPYYCTFYHPSILIRKQLLQDNPYSSDFPYAEDYELWHRLTFIKKIKGENLKEYLLAYRFTPSQSSNAHIIQQMQSVKRIMNCYNNTDISMTSLKTAIINCEKLDNIDFLHLQQISASIFNLKNNYPILSRYCLFLKKNSLYKNLSKLLFSRAGQQMLFTVFLRKVLRKVARKRLFYKRNKIYP